MPRPRRAPLALPSRLGSRGRKPRLRAIRLSKSGHEVALHGLEEGVRPDRGAVEERVELRPADREEERALTGGRRHGGGLAVDQSHVAEGEAAALEYLHKLRGIEHAEEGEPAQVLETRALDRGERVLRKVAGEVVRAGDRRRAVAERRGEGGVPLTKSLARDGRNPTLDCEGGRVEPRDEGREIGPAEEERCRRLDRPHRRRPGAAVDERNLAQDLADAEGRELDLPVAGQSGGHLDEALRDHVEAVHLLPLTPEVVTGRELDREHHARKLVEFLGRNASEELDRPEKVDDVVRTRMRARGRS